ncbi:MAG: mechanosensitive ion channel family protein [Solirubrobacterales bacterium]|nr:mechanosensitive ion channel family protein [Solirubrobacterales bacterium]
MRIWRKVSETHMKKDMKQLFETRSHSWVDAGLARQVVSRRALRRARLQILVAGPLLAGVLVLYSHRKDFAGADAPIRAVTVIALLMLGYALIRDLGRLLGPALFRRMDPPTAGTVGFLIRLFGIVVITGIALRIAGLGASQLAVGGAFTAIIAGLAAQQTLGNLFAGLVLLSARPFRVGDRVKLQGGGIEIEGVVSTLGLLYTTFDYGDNTTMVPNSSVLNVAVTPLREPDGVDLKARLPSDVTPSQIEALLRENVETPLRGRPNVSLEELDGDELVVRIAATPRNPQDGAHLASEVLEVVSREAIRAAGAAANGGDASRN